MTAISETDCRTSDGVTVGLVDAVISIARVLRHRDLTPSAVVEALRDLASDEDTEWLIAQARAL